MISLEVGLREAAKKMIAKCKKKAYGRQASNKEEGDYGTWKDWEDVLVQFAAGRILKEGMSVVVTDPKHDDSSHSHSFSGTVTSVYFTGLRVRDQEDNHFDVEFDEIESYEEDGDRCDECRALYPEDAEGMVGTFHKESCSLYPENHV